MARKTVIYTVDADNRDNGKQFVITEMPAYQAEKWAYRLFLGLAAGGIEVPENVKESGMLGVASMGAKALVGLPWGLAEPLLDELLSCVQIRPDPSKPAVLRSDIMNDIEEPTTFMRLRMEVIALHVGFSPAELLSGAPAAWEASTKGQ